MRALIATLALVACSSSPPRSAARAPTSATGSATATSTAELRPAPPAPPPDAAIDAPPDAPACPPTPLAKGCPATEPNVNHPCNAKALKGVECVYAPGCCPNPIYVCNKTGHFEAHFSSCP